MDAGWQGNKGYYFSVGIDIGSVIGSTETYKTAKGEEEISDAQRFNNISDSYQHRTKVKEFYEKGKTPSFVYLGFGWYIKG